MLRGCAGAVVRMLPWLVAMGCGNADHALSTSVWDLRLPDAEGKEVRLGDLRGKQGTLLLVLSPDCPMCMNYAGLLAEFPAQGEAVQAIGLFPTEFIPTDSVRAFARRYGIGMPLLMDTNCAVVNALNATVTPEAFLVDAEGRYVYRGAIDDWAVRAGRKKVKATKHYLQDALAALRNGQLPEQRAVQAVGCVLECE